MSAFSIKGLYHAMNQVWNIDEKYKQKQNIADSESLVRDVYNVVMCQ